MSHSVSSGLLTSVLATGMLVSFVAWGSSFMYIALFWLMGKCYVNSFLAMLNSRDTLRERSYNAFRMSSIRQSKTPYKCKTGPTTVSVTVHRTVTADFATSKHDCNEPELEKSEGITIPSVHDESRASIV